MPGLPLASSRFPSGSKQLWWVHNAIRWHLRFHMASFSSFLIFFGLVFWDLNQYQISQNIAQHSEKHAFYSRLTPRSHGGTRVFLKHAFSLRRWERKQSGGWCIVLFLSRGIWWTRFHAEILHLKVNQTLRRLTRATLLFWGRADMCCHAGAALNTCACLTVH